MALTKKDLSQIRNAVRQEVRATTKNLATKRGVRRAVDNLATIVAKGFKQVDKRFEGIDKRFGGIDKRLELIDKRLEKIDAEIRHINARLDMIEHDLADIKKHFVYRGEFEEVLARLAFIEKRIGIKK